MELLVSDVRRYAWGSRTAIADLQGRPAPTEEPEAELWIGAHPSAPSTLSRDDGRVGLDAAVAADPEGELGAAVASRYGPRLPFLFKLIAADAPLSLQVHPDDEQARAGYAAADAAGVPADAPTRSYVDAFGKPELVCAVTPFDVLCGFRPIEESLVVLAELDAAMDDAVEAASIARIVSALRADPTPSALAAVFSALMTLPPDVRERVAAVAVAACAAAAERGRRFGADFARAAELGKRYPGDIGAVTSLLLNHRRLAAGEAVFLPAGVLHGYLGGVAVEAMACSDNVLRGGLTTKHVDVEELLRLVRVEPGPLRLLEPEEPAPGVRTWRPPTPDFLLTRVDLDRAPGGVTLTGDGPQVLFCLAGRVSVVDADGVGELPAGQAGYVRAGRGPATLTGDGVAFRTTTG